MKLRQQQINKIEQLLDALEEKLEQMEQQDYMSFDLGKDLQSVSFMLDKIREEIEIESKLAKYKIYNEDNELVAKGELPEILELLINLGYRIEENKNGRS